jgi:hypothetical protein
MITVSSFSTGITSQDMPTVRGACTGWNDQIARRAGAYVSNFRQDFRVFGTLTYPHTFPKDGAEVKRHWRAFIERLRRIGWLKTGSIFWWLEFQQRGAPHLHYLATEWIGKEWVSEAWAEITGGDSRACSRVEAIRHPDRMGQYVTKYMMKSEQKEIPEGFRHVGRMWGISGPKFFEGKPRLPFVAAATRSGLLSGFYDILLNAIGLMNARLVKTQLGYTIYGTEEEIERIWIYLSDRVKCIGLVVRYPEYQTPERSDGWSGLPVEQAKAARKSKQWLGMNSSSQDATRRHAIARDCPCSYHSALRLQLRQSP